jgi:hypothetical protein
MRTSVKLSCWTDSVCTYSGWSNLELNFRSRKPVYRILSLGAMFSSERKRLLNPDNSRSFSHYLARYCSWLPSMHDYLIREDSKWRTELETLEGEEGWGNTRRCWGSCDVISSWYLAIGFLGGCWRYRNVCYLSGGVLVVTWAVEGTLALKTPCTDIVHKLVCLSSVLTLEAQFRSAWYRLVVEVVVVTFTPYSPYSSVFLFFRKPFSSSVVFEAQTSQVEFHWPLN